MLFAFLFFCTSSLISPWILTWTLIVIWTLTWTCLFCRRCYGTWNGHGTLIGTCPGTWTWKKIKFGLKLDMV